MFLLLTLNKYMLTGCVRVSFLTKLQAKACNFIIKEALAQVLSCDFGEIFKNILLYRTPPVAASESLWGKSEICKISKFRGFSTALAVF